MRIRQSLSDVFTTGRFWIAWLRAEAVISTCSLTGLGRIVRNTFSRRTSVFCGLIRTMSKVDYFIRLLKWAVSLIREMLEGSYSNWFLRLVHSIMDLGWSMHLLTSSLASTSTVNYVSSLALAAFDSNCYRLFRCYVCSLALFMREFWAGIINYRCSCSSIIKGCDRISWSGFG